MGHYRKTDPTTAMSNLLKQALIVQRWAEREGTVEQKKITAGWVTLIAQYGTKISPKFNGVILSDQASYDANQLVSASPPKPPPPPDPTLEEVEQISADGYASGEFNDCPYTRIVDSQRCSAWDSGVVARLKAISAEKSAANPPE